MPGTKACIIGVGPGGADSLTAAMRRRLRRADIVCGGRRLLDMFPALPGEKVVIGHNLAEIAGLLRRNQGRKRVVVLASGDPGFYGIAGYLADRLGSRRLEIMPNVSAMQLAFARLGLSWEDAALLSVHARPIEDIVAAVRRSDKIGIFTDDKHTPADVADILLKNGLGGYRAYVCENLGGKDERIVGTSLRGLLRGEFSPLNTLILLKDKRRAAAKSPSPALGIPDRDFHRRRPQEGMITKQEVRAISLAKLRLTAESVVWDIGAGSGALSVEASRLADRGRVYAVEKNADDIAVIGRNIRKFRAANVEAVHARAPAGLDGLPDPSAVFVGGSGGGMETIIEAAAPRLRPGGRIVVNVVGLENLSAALGALRERGFITEITLVSVARSAVVGELTRLAALNPVFIIDAGRENHGDE